MLSEDPWDLDTLRVRDVAYHVRLLDPKDVATPRGGVLEPALCAGIGVSCDFSVYELKYSPPNDNSASSPQSCFV